MILSIATSSSISVQVGGKCSAVASYPAAALLPRFDFAGNLYIGMDARTLSGTLTLFFQLREDSQPLPSDTSLLQQPDGAGSGLHWFYLSANA